MELVYLLFEWVGLSIASDSGVSHFFTEFCDMTTAPAPDKT